MISVQSSVNPEDKAKENATTKTRKVEKHERIIMISFFVLSDFRVFVIQFFLDFMIKELCI